MSTLEDIDNEPINVGRISIDEVRNDPDIVSKRVEAKVMAILNKYDHTLSIQHFQWVDGTVQATIAVVKKPSE